MKLLTKLSTLIKAVTRGPAPQRPRKPQVPTPSDLPDVEATPHATIVEQQEPLEEGHIADLLQRKLDASESGPQQREKGD